MNELSSFQVVTECFRQKHWNFQADVPQRFLRSDFNAKHACYKCLVRVEEADDLVQFVTLLPFIVPANKRTIVAELCVRLSYSLRDGRFDMNFQNGELRYYIARAYPKGRLEEGVVAQTLLLGLFTADHHLPIFVNTLFGNPSPQTALDQPCPRPRINLN